MFDMIRSAIEQLGSMRRLMQLSEQVRAQLAQQRFVAASTTGGVKIEANGAGEIIAVNVSDELAQAADGARLEQEIAEAVKSLVDWQKKVVQDTLFEHLPRLIQEGRSAAGDVPGT